MRGVISTVELFEDTDQILFEISVYDGTNLIATVPLVRLNDRFTETELKGLILTAIRIAQNPFTTTTNKYLSQTSLSSDLLDYEYDEEV